MREIKLYIAVSLDGKIAGPDGNIDWLDEYNNPKEDYGYKEFLDSIDITIMGHHTYNQILTFEGDFPYKSKKNYVFTHNTDLKNDENVTFISSDFLLFVETLKKESGKNIWMIGGGLINQFFLKHRLIDRFILFVIPTILGEGIPLFAKSDEIVRLTFDKSKQYPNGVIELNYYLKNE